MTNPVKPRFRLSIISVLILLAAIGARGWLFYRISSAQSISPFAIGEFLGGVVGSILLPLLLAWVVWRICGRSSLAGNLIFCLLTLALATMAWQKTERLQAGLKAMDQAQQSFVSNMRETFKDPKSAPGAAVDQLNRFSDTMAKATNQMEGREKKAGEAGQRFFKLLTAKMQGYNTATQALSQAGFSRVKGIGSKEDIQHRRELVKAFEAANQDVTEFYSNAGKIFRGELEKESLDGPYIDEVIRGFNKSASVDLVLKVRACDAELVVQMNKLLDLYDREWGTWRVDDNGKVIFVNPMAVEEFQTAQTSISDIADRQKIVQQEVLKSAEASKISPH